MMDDVEGIVLRILGVVVANFLSTDHTKTGAFTQASYPIEIAAVAV